MRAQRYGTIPVARRVGGLHDSIADGETGFLFNAYEPAALEQAVQGALAGFHDRAAWRTIMRRAMAQQLGWDGSAARYLDVYRRALALRATAGWPRGWISCSRCTVICRTCRITAGGPMAAI